AAGLLSVLVLPMPADAQQAESRQAESHESGGSASATAGMDNAADTASAQGHTTSLAPIRVTAEFDPDDVRPEGVTTATKTYLA
ncbi:hypothetical protein NL487_28275, partial [Klebsiella pneumoniae]|nr:hypothetical protein [Klebsiella pneumoniae]